MCTIPRKFTPVQTFYFPASFSHSPCCLISSNTEKVFVSRNYSSHQFTFVFLILKFFANILWTDVLSNDSICDEIVESYNPYSRWMSLCDVDVRVVTTLSSICGISSREFEICSVSQTVDINRFNLRCGYSEKDIPCFSVSDVNEDNQCLIP
jgi:hypothetical protein